MTGPPPADRAELRELVAEAETGARETRGLAGAVLLAVALAWSLFQVWYASPLPFALGAFILNDTEARAIHLAFALFLAFAAYPAFRRSPRRRIPGADWALGLAGAFAGAYLFLFYRELAARPGQPTAFDLATAGAGLLLLLEATRRALGPAMALVALVFAGYTFLGPWMPEVIQHKGASLHRFLSHQWLTTEGVFGVALGVSTGFVFLFVLFGSLLEKAGAGNWMMQVSFALLGRLRGGPAKVAVVSSALNGVISGSSVSNVVSGGIFTIPMMKRSGLSGVKAGAIEAASSVNGQIMPPVMGAAAFLMTEYVGIPYSEIVRHALLPALISYVALFYIVHLEALKIGARPLSRSAGRPRGERWLRLALGTAGSVVALCAVYWSVLGARALFGAGAGWALGFAGGALYVALLGFSARSPDLAPDDPEGPIVAPPEAWAVARTGLHFLLPLAVLVWCLMVERMSPGLSAFWATAAIMAMLLTQRPILAAFRGAPSLAPALRQGCEELIDGLRLGARNMIGIAVATATAGIVVGVVTLTGMGLMMTDFVEYLSGGDAIAMLLLTAFISLVLGMGIPTTANYILVATLMAPVVVELGAQAGLAIPLIAVHLFVFYFGIMADVTPPVGLASYAAAAISGEDPIRTGLQGSVYALRTAVLPFIFIFNPALLLIDVDGWVEIALVAASATLASCVFAAGTMGWFLTRSRPWETAALLLVCFTLFRPDWWLNRLHEPHRALPATEIFRIAEAAPAGGRVAAIVEGLNLEGEEVRKTVSLRLDAPGAGRDRLAATGARLVESAGEVLVGDVRPGSYARRAGLEPGFAVRAVLTPAERPAKEWVFLPALALLGLVAAVQRARARRERAAAV